MAMLNNQMVDNKNWDYPPVRQASTDHGGVGWLCRAESVQLAEHQHTRGNGLNIFNWEIASMASHDFSYLT